MTLLLGVDDRHRRHFIPVVIFRFDPEDRDGRNAVLLGDTRGEFYRCQCLVQREQWTTEQTRLLSGHDRDALRIGEAGRRVARGLWRIAAFELTQKNAAELGPIARMLLCVGN